MSIFRKEKIERVLLVHIGSSTVTGALGLLENNSLTITSSISKDIAVIQDLSFNKFEDLTKVTLEQTLEHLYKKTETAPERIFVHLASPWYASQVRIARVERSSDFVVTKSFIEEILTKELSAFKEEEMDQKKNYGELAVLESKTLHVKLNGYPNDDPLGLTAHEMELSVFVSVAPLSILNKIKDALSKYYTYPKITFSSILASSYLVVRDYFANLNDYLLVDVGGEVTDVSLIRGKALIRSVSFPSGRNFILRRLSAGLNRTIEESITLCTLYSEGKVEEGLRSDCEKVLNEAKTEWLSHFQKALFTVSDELSIPETILLSCHADVSGWFIEAIRREEFHQYTLTEKEFKVILLDANLFSNSIRFAPNIIRDPFIIIGGLHLAYHQNISITKAHKTKTYA